jgi:hypothetical protein
LSPPYRPSPARPLPLPVPLPLAVPLPVPLRPDAASVQSCSASVVSHHPGGFLRACGAGLLHPAADGGSPRFARMDPPVFTRRTGTRGPRDAFRTPRRTPLVCSRTVSPRPLPSCLSRQISRHRAPERSLEHGYRRGRIRSVPANRGFRIPLADPSRLPTLRSAVGPGRAPRGPAHPRTRGCGVDAHPRIPSLESRMRQHAGAPAPIGCPTCAGSSAWPRGLRQCGARVRRAGPGRTESPSLGSVTRSWLAPGTDSHLPTPRSRPTNGPGPPGEPGHGTRDANIPSATSEPLCGGALVERQAAPRPHLLRDAGFVLRSHRTSRQDEKCSDRIRNRGPRASAVSRPVRPDGLGAFVSDRASLRAPAFGSERTSASGAPASHWEMSRIRQAGCVPLAGSPSAAPSREARCRVSPFAPSLAGDRLQGLSPPTSP